MARQRGGLIGRRKELDALVGQGHPGPALVRGIPGSGKTALLQNVRRVLMDRAAPVLDVSFPSNVPAWDLFGFRAVLQAVREQYDLFDTDLRLPDSIDDVTRLCTEDGYADRWTRFCLLHAMSTLFTRLNTTAPVAVLLDDLHRLTTPMLAVAPMHRAGHAVIASSRMTLAGTVDLLDGAFLQTIELEPLSSEESVGLLRRVARGRVAPATVQAVREALGPLWGNPAAVVATMTDLRDRGRLKAVDGVAYLQNPQTPVALPAAHPILAELARFGAIGKQLLLLAAGPNGLSVDDLPFVTGGEEETKVAGQAVDALIRDGILECEAADTVRCRVPGVGAALAEEVGLRGPGRLHREIAERLWNRSGVSQSHLDTLARHVALAGRELPSRPELSSVLEEAESLQAVDAPTRTRHLYAAWWHAGQETDRSARQTEIVRHLVRVADYSTMAEFVAEASDDAPDAARAELAVGAVLAALHLGRPVPGGLCDRLSRSDAARAVLGLAERWFAGDRLEPHDVSACLTPLWRQICIAAPQLSRRTWPSLRCGGLVADATAMGDLAPVLRAVLGSDYRVPSSGPLSVYHRACTGYAEGRWADALGAVEELGTQDAVDTPFREHARLLAAEMCGWQSDGRRASEWLATVPRSSHLRYLRAWVEAGLHHHAGENEEAFEAGLRAFRARPFSYDDLGASWLLTRLAWLAGVTEKTGMRRIVVDVAETYHEFRLSARSFGALALVRGLVEGAGTRIHAAERLVSKRGDHELVLLNEPAAQLSTLPRGWLRDAAEHSRPRGAARPVGKTREAMNPGARMAVERSEAEMLSDTELEILQLIRTGQTNRQIARVVRLSEKTVEKHLSRLFLKAGCRTRYGLATSALARPRDVIGA
ncbi:AAA ATPase domain-containing protein [Amycolatopsis lurida]|nr:LuxR family transcriptional regulator [Amycolatopsis lurida]SEE31256.1 AAA ATPase domain-containing protein [Amycolatopsis lurida]